MEQQLKSLLKELKSNESSISMLLGGMVMIVTAVLIISYFRSTPKPQITQESSSTTSGVMVQNVVEDEDKLEVDSDDDRSEKLRQDLETIQQDVEETSKDIEEMVKGKVGKVSEDLDLPSTGETEEDSQLPKGEKEISDYMQMGGSREHKVQAGENLWRIAEVYYGSGYNWVDIAKANSLKQPSIIEVGQVLMIPDAPERASTATQSSLSAAEALGRELIKGTSYTVEKNDTLWDISLRSYADGYRWTQIWQANKELIDDPNIIETGQVLVIPR